MDPRMSKWVECFEKKLTFSPCLLPLNWNRPFHVYCDTSKAVVGSALCQLDENGKKHPKAFVNKQLTNMEHNYTTIE
jgi:hypothetical protein